MRNDPAGFVVGVTSVNVVQSVAISLLPWPALRLSTCFFSFLKGVLLLLFLLDWVLLSSLGILGEVGPLAPIWAFSCSLF